MEFLIFWFIFCVIVGAIATSKERNFIGWTLLAFLISPFIAGIIVLVLPKLKSNFEYKMEVQKMIDSGNKNKINISDEIQKLFTLKETGAITPDEFELQKKKLLS